MDPITGAALIGGGTQLVQSIINARQSRSNVRRTNRAQMELAQYGYNKDLEMWHRQNEYNSPKAQMQRFKDAGLNPHLMYGQGTPGTAQQMPQYNVPRLDFRDELPAVDIGSTIGRFMDIRQQSEQIKNIQQRTALESANEALARMREIKGFNENDITVVEAQIAKAMIQKEGDGAYVWDQQKINNLGDALRKSRLAKALFDSARGRMQQIETKFADEYKMTMRDATYLRAIINFFEGMGVNADQVRDALFKGFK